MGGTADGRSRTLLASLALVLVTTAGCATDAAAPPSTSAAAPAPPIPAPPTTAPPAPPPVPELPGGGTTLFPGRRMVALYGHPGTAALGVLGEQGIEQSVVRAQRLAEEYRPLTPDPVVPAFEIITTVASSTAGADGDYSNETKVADLVPWVDAAAAAGIYVVLDLQPGRSDFLSQARLYTDLLARPNVGLALDPEWRLGPGQRHRVQVGSVDVAEINQVSGWLADLTRDRGLPQKLLMIHQFRTAMVRDRAGLVTDRDELSVVVHADGFGTSAEKMETWTVLHEAAPPGITWGWKNFVDEDEPVYTPAQTLAVGPTTPVFVSYQ
ncbi:MAG: hypothetical protein OJJ54_01825 [Pseudonocardia sp.]|nr:hypothetical protein [Pseudonocardia sp.]